MVYYYTSKNVKLLRDIIKEYETSVEISACEYMTMFIEKCPDSMEDTKISWIVESFLSFQKHDQFHNEIKSYLSKELAEQDEDYFIIAFHAILFQIVSEDMILFYKCLFNLSKHLLNVFTNILSNNNVLIFVSNVAQKYYDANFVTEKIIGPLNSWQPCLKEMSQKYSQYMKKIESKKYKQPTLSISPTVLNRHFKISHRHSLTESLPNTPSKSLNNPKIKVSRMLMKSKIDKKLKEIHEINKQNALLLLQNVKDNNSHYTKGKKTKEVVDINKDEYKKTPKLRTYVSNTTSPVVKETTTTLKRIDKRIKLSQKEELQWLDDLMTNFRNTKKIEKLEDFDRQERERERLLDIEKKHLLGQISFEEAVIAKKRLQEENKKKYENFLKEKRLWEEEMEMWKRNEMEKNRTQVEKLSLLELHMLYARQNNIAVKKEMAENLRKESEELLAKAAKEKQEELENKIKMIKELKIFSMIAKKVKAPQIIDLTESSGLGLLCEMSISELREKLALVKIGLKEELNKKRKYIKEQKDVSKRDLKETKKCIEKYMSERASLRKQNKMSMNSSYVSSSNEIKELRKVLEEKRNLRIKLSI